MQELKHKLLNETKEKIDSILNEGINAGNLDHLYKLVDIYKDTKEVENMYDNYGRRPGYDTYGNYDNYGRRGYDMKYRGHDHIERMADHYGRYMDGKQRYGTNEETKRSLEYMLRSMEDFARMLKEDTQSQEEIEMIRQTAQRIAQM